MSSSMLDAVDGVEQAEVSGDVGDLELRGAEHHRDLGRSCESCEHLGMTG